MIKRSFLFFFAVLGIVSGTALSVVSSPAASAWNGALPTCSYDLNTPWQQNMATIDADWRAQDRAVFIGDVGGNLLTVYSVHITSTYPHPINFAKTGADTYQLEVRGYPDGKYATFNPTTGDTVSYGTINNENIPYAVCVSALQNASYSNDWDQPQFPGSIPNPGGACNAWDFACYFSKIGDSITDLFEGVAETLVAIARAIVQGFAMLFLPSEGILQAFFSDLSSFFTQKLGFLLYPFEFFGDLFEALTSNSDQCTEYHGTFENSELLHNGTFFGQPVNLSLCSIQTSLPLVWQIVTLIIRSITIFAVVIALRKKIMEVMKR